MSLLLSMEETSVGRSLLSEVVMEISHALSYVPRLHQRMAWRLHPDDMTLVAEEMKMYTAKMGDKLMKEMWIKGVRIFPDTSAPRIGSESEGVKG